MSSPSTHAPSFELFSAARRHPIGAWLYFAKDGEALHSIVEACYTDFAVASAVCEVIVGFQTSGTLSRERDLKSDIKMQANTRVMLPE